MKSFKKIFVLFCALAMILSLSACNSSSKQEEESGTTASDNSYSLVQNVYSWGAGYSKIIVPVNFKGDVDYLDAKDYKVSVTRYNTANEILNSGNRVITAVYRSDEKGKSSDSGNYVTLDLATAATIGLSSPYYTDPNSFGSTLKSWAKCDYVVTNDKTGEVWDSANTVYYPDEEKYQTSVFESDKTIPYAYYEADTTEKHPLVVWLHGAGSGGTDIGFVTGGMLVTNFVSDEVQEIFNGADILLPQCETVWMDDGSGAYTSDGTSAYTTSLKALIDDYIANHENIDTSRVYIGGCSNGGYMTVKLAIEYPELFAACFPVCEAYESEWISDEEVAKIVSVPTWFVHCSSDPVVDINTTAIALYERMKEAGASDLHFTVYDSIVDPDYGNSYIGHFAWVYSLKNMCRTDYDGSPVTVDGQEVSLYQWLMTCSK